MLKNLYNKLRFKQLGGSPTYWGERRYDQGGNSGDGSYGESAAHKAAFLNAFVEEHGIQSVIEFGCGDGAQLSLATYPQYVGMDISPKAIEICRKKFAGDSTKRFLHPGEAVEPADLALSLDVIFHLVENGTYRAYMKQLFAASKRFVLIYATNYDKRSDVHVRHRHFTPDVARWFPEFELGQTLDAPDPKLCPFFVYRRNCTF